MFCCNFFYCTREPHFLLLIDYSENRKYNEIMIKTCIINTKNGSQNNQDIVTKYIDTLKLK